MCRPSAHPEGPPRRRWPAGAAGALVAELGALGGLSGPGAAQLAADLDNFCNVLAALVARMALSPPLLTWRRARTPGQPNVGCVMGCSPGLRPCCRRRCPPGGHAFLSRVRLHGRAESHGAPPLVLWQGGSLEPDGAGLPGAPRGSAAYPLLPCMRCRDVPAGELAVSVTISGLPVPGLRAEAQARSAGGGGGARAHADTGGRAPRAGGGGPVGGGVAAAAAAALDDGVREPQTLQRVAAACGLSRPRSERRLMARGGLLAELCLGPRASSGAHAGRRHYTLGCERPQGWARYERHPHFPGGLPLLRAANMSSTAGCVCGVGMLELELGTCKWLFCVGEGG